MTIAEAAEAVLKDLNRPMHVREIYSQINTRKLFEFKAKDPVSVVSKAMRQGKQFVKTEPGTFRLRQ